MTSKTCFDDPTMRALLRLSRILMEIAANPAPGCSEEKESPCLGESRPVNSQNRCRAARARARTSARANHGARGVERRRNG